MGVLISRAGILLAVAGATIIGFWLRAALAFSSGLWRDEVQSATIAQLPGIAEVLGFLAREESHPPLFYLLERAWVAVAGGSDRSLVMLGLLPGVAIIPAGAFVACRLGGSFAGVLTSLYVAVAWPLLWQSGDARPYALLALLTLAATAAAFDAATRGARASWVIYAPCSLALIYTHNWSLLIVAGLAVLTLITIAHRPGTNAEALRRWAWTHALIALLYVPWIPVLLGQARSAGYGLASRLPVEWPIIASTLALAVSLKLLVPAVAVLVLGAWKGGVTDPGVAARRFFIWAAVLPCTLAIALWRVSDLTVSHCAAILTPTALTAVALTLGALGTPSTMVRRLVAGGCLLSILGLATTSRWNRKSNMREMAAELSAASSPGDLLLVYPASLGPAVQRYLGDDREVVTFPPQTPISPTRFAGYWGRFDEPASWTEVAGRIETAHAAGKGVVLLSQLRRDPGADSTARIGTRERYWYGIAARLDQFRSALDSGFVPMKVAAPPGTSSWTRETIQVVRYAPRGSSE